MRIPDRLDDKISRVERVLVAVLLTLMILVAFSQIVLRNFFATGLAWGESLIRYLVVWVGFIGAAIATQEGKHITIDILSRWVRGAGGIVIQAVAHFFSAVICGLLTFAAVKFIGFEAHRGGTSIFNLPVWGPELILPVTFGLMTLRFALHFAKQVARILGATSNRAASNKESGP
jgi:C4-dicarboxylate transporter DctQ subunit